MNAPISKLLLQSDAATISKPAAGLVEPNPAAGEVSRSYYRPDFNPDDACGWPRRIAHEPKLAGALELFRERFGFDGMSVGEAAMHLSQADWRRWDTYERLACIRSLLDALITADMDRSLGLVNVGPVSTIGD